MAPIEVAKRHDDAFNARDVESRTTIEAPDIEVFMPGVALRGTDQVIQAVKGFWEALPDVRLQAENRVAEGDTVVVQGRLVGTHEGTFRAPPDLEIPPTGRSVNLPYAAVKRIKDGKLLSEQIHFDRLELLQQLGVSQA
jgi:predicted ester cyclase